jgi:hypothetical protein
MTKTTPLTVKLDGEWNAEELREMSNLMRVIENIPEATRADAIESAQRLLEIDRKKDAIRLVWSRP